MEGWRSGWHLEAPDLSQIEPTPSCSPLITCPGEWATNIPRVRPRGERAFLMVTLSWLREGQHLATSLNQSTGTIGIHSLVVLRAKPFPGWSEYLSRAIHYEYYFKAC
ncbi:unnamed protein product [Sphagnum tenellum]